LRGNKLQQHHHHDNFYILIFMPALATYTNVLNTALVILQRKGFRVWSDNDETNWFAERDGWDFQADDPIQLLGLIGIFEFQKPAEYREYWWQLQEPYLIENVPKQAPDYIPVYSQKKRKA
jgi:hypothetical protein